MAEPLAPECSLCACVAGREPEGVVAENRLWQLRSLPAPVPVPGWVMLVAKRHIAGPFEFDDHESSQFGAVLQRVSQALRKLTGASRVYLAVLGEAVPHLHCHFVPRTDDLPGGVKGWSVFDLQRRAIAGELEPDAAAVAAMLGSLRAELGGVL